MINSCNVYISGFFTKDKLECDEKRDNTNSGFPLNASFVCSFNGLLNKVENKAKSQSCPGTTPDSNLSGQKIRLHEKKITGEKKKKSSIVQTCCPCRDVT